MTVVVHVVDLDLPAPDLDRLTSTLDDGERRRAASLESPLLRSRFAACHGWARVAIGRELGVDPREVPLVAPADSKPRVEGAPLRFSWSRSAGVAVIALSWSGEVGVDVEVVGGEGDPLRFAARWFTPAEQRIVREAPPGARSRRCLQIWTRKEAYLKATGAGLSVSPSGIEVAHDDLGPIRLSGYLVRQLDLGPNLASAVAVADQAAVAVADSRAVAAQHSRRRRRTSSGRRALGLSLRNLELGDQA
ncbi:MAG: 4'-phosphopantetheinyl transferase superfamily protein [Actinomycetota bacterium]|nr:4'-phosphopantetheinyl transferase superfamily protein [Actinomycetota bacterium]